MSAMRDKTPMETEYPVLCEWTRHGAVSTDALRAELLRALAWLAESTPATAGTATSPSRCDSCHCGTPGFPARCAAR